MPKQKFDRTPIVSGEEILKNADKEILQDFLYILVNYYPMAKNSILSLENETDEISLSAIMQLRDFIDHTYLAMSIHEDMKIDMKKHQISNAAEHLRRSIVEPYQRKILDCIKEIKDYYTIYKKSPFRLFGIFGIEKIITLDEVEKGIEVIRKLLHEGRILKSKYLWDEDFEEAITENFVPALNYAIDLRENLFKATMQIGKWKAAFVLSFAGSLIVLMISIALNTFLNL